VIQVNLLEARPGGSVRRAWILPAQRPAALGLLLLLLTALSLGGWWWQLQREAGALDASIAASAANLRRLQAAADLVQRATARKADLTERLALIDRLHRIKRDPVDLLEAVSLAVPDGLWLLELKQQKDAIQIEGRAVSITALTDFVEHLQTSGRFERPVDIITTSMEAVADVPVVRFAVRGRALAAPAAPAARGASVPAARQ
jgi:Tfp pilus assembly protein PilN